MYGARLSPCWGGAVLVRAVAVLVLAVAAGTVTSATAGQARAPGFGGRFDPIFVRALAAGAIKNGAIVVVRDGTVAFAKGYGLVAPGKSAVDPALSVFLAGSTAKPLVAVTVLALAAEGRLRLDEDVNAVLRRGQRRALPISNVTLRGLLTHTSGIVDDLRGALALPSGPLPSLASYFDEHPPHQRVAAGRHILYSNVGMALAAYIAEVATRTPFQRLVQQHLFDPLGMNSSTFAQPGQGGHAILARLVPAGPPGRQAPRLVPYPAGSLATSAADMGRLLVALLAGGRSGGRQALPRAAVTALEAPSFQVAPGMPGVSAGFFEIVVGQHGLVETGDRGQHSILYLDPSHHIGLYGVVTSADAAAGPLRQALIRAVMRLAGPVARFRPTGPRSVADAKRYLGTFRAVDGSGTITIAGNARGLVARTGRHSILLYPSRSGLFRAADGSFVAFTGLCRGRAQALDVSDGFLGLPFVSSRAR